MESTQSKAILVYGKHPFSVQNSVKDQGCLIDECLVIRLGMKVRHMEYSKFTLKEGKVTKCCGNISATSQILENGRASKSITFKAKIIRDLGCDAVGDSNFFKKFQSLNPIKDQDIKNDVFNPVKDRNRKDKRETSSPPKSILDNTRVEDAYDDNIGEHKDDDYNKNGSYEDEYEYYDKDDDDDILEKSYECEDDFNEDGGYEGEYEYYDKNDEDDILEKSYECEDDFIDNDEEIISLPITREWVDLKSHPPLPCLHSLKLKKNDETKCSNLSLNDKTVSYIEHLIKFEAGIDVDSENSGWYEIQDSDPILSELCLLIETGQAPTTKNKLLKRDFNQKHGVRLENPGDLKRLYGRFRKGDLKLNDKDILVHKKVNEAIVIPSYLMRSILEIITDLFGQLTRSKLKKLVEQRFSCVRLDQEI